MDRFKNLFFMLLISAAVITGCSEDPIPEPDPGTGVITKQEAPALTQKVNQFIQDGMEDVYLWYNYLPNIDLKYEHDSKAYFKKLLYKDEDVWSFITDDVVKLENSFQGVETSYGYSLAFGKFSNTGDWFAVVEFVYPNTPASEAGLKRGDILMEIDGKSIKDDTYMQLLEGSTITVTLGELTDQGIRIASDVTMTSRELNLDPVLITKVIEHEGHKIGYLFYAQYIAGFNDRIGEALSYFQEEQVTDVVVDLRYNPGGVITAAQYLCSALAPLNVVNTSNALVTFQWNDKYQRYWEEKNIRDQLQVGFMPDVPVKMGLNKVHVLTGRGTASASELTITGLNPYMNVTTVGDTTYGKYTASITLKPEDFYTTESYYSDFKNWGIQPIVIRYANSLGVTDFKNGFTPDILVEDDLLAAIPLGDKTEPLLKAAIEDITGSEIVAVKKARITPAYSIIDRGFSKFDENKRELVFDGVNKEMLLK